MRGAKNDCGNCVFQYKLYLSDHRNISWRSIYVYFLCLKNILCTVRTSAYNFCIITQENVLTGHQFKRDTEMRYFVCGLFNEQSTEVIQNFIYQLNACLLAERAFFAVY